MVPLLFGFLSDVSCRRFCRLTFDYSAVVSLFQSHSILDFPPPRPPVCFNSVFFHFPLYCFPSLRLFSTRCCKRQTLFSRHFPFLAFSSFSYLSFRSFPWASLASSCLGDEVLSFLFPMPLFFPLLFVLPPFSEKSFFTDPFFF